MTLLSERLINARKLKNISRTDIAKNLKIPYSTYAGYEQGLRQPDIETLAKIASKLETSTDYLSGKVDDPDPTSSINYDLDKMIDNARSFDGKPLDDHDRELAREILKKIYK